MKEVKNCARQQKWTHLLENERLVWSNQSQIQQEKTQITFMTKVHKNTFWFLLLLKEWQTQMMKNAQGMCVKKQFLKDVKKS